MLNQQIRLCKSVNWILEAVRAKRVTCKLFPRHASAYSILQSPGTSANAPTTGSGHTPTKQGVVLYKWPTMKHFRFISKFKIYQVSLMLLLFPPAAYWYSLEKLSGQALGFGGVALLGTTAALAVISHYFSRIAGELSYDPLSETLRISTLTFMGNRRETVFLVDDVVSFVESQTRMGGAIQRLEVKGQQGVFLWSLRYGRVLDLNLLCKVLKIADIDLSHF